MVAKGDDGSVPVDAEARTASVADFKRQLIRDAAKEIFVQSGIEAASVRKITQRAGYAPSALYTYYETKEQLYADILRVSMNELRDALTETTATDADGLSATRSSRLLHAMLRFYRERPDDFDLSFHLYSGARPSGIEKNLNRELNQQMKGVIRTIAEALAEDGFVSHQEADHAAVSAASHVFGLVLMANTGRLRLLDEKETELLDTFLNTLNLRHP